MIKKSLFFLLVLFILTGCQNKNFDVLKNVRTVTVTKLNFDLHTNTLTNGLQYNINNSPETKKVLTSDEREFLNQTYAQIFNIFRERSSIQCLISSDSFNAESKKTFQHVVPSAHSDGCIEGYLSFCRLENDKVFDGTYNKMEAKLQLYFIDLKGNKTEVYQCTGTSKKEIRRYTPTEALLLNQKFVGFQDQFELDSDMGPLFKEAVEDLLKKVEFDFQSFSEKVN